jgi:hypothetical protein
MVTPNNLVVVVVVASTAAVRSQPFALRIV